MAGGAGSIGILWTIRFCWLPNGVQQQGVPVAQSLAATNDFGANGGLIVCPGGNNPTGANIDTALTTLATNAKAYFDNGTPLAIIQNWNTGAG